jgi:serine O-acetyltransferase
LNLKQTLLADLRQHYYYYDGTPDREPSMSGIFKKVVNLKFTPVLIYRLAKYFYNLGVSPIAQILSLINFVVFGIEIGLRCRIGDGVYFPHTIGTVIGATTIGENAVIFQGVTLGSKAIDIGYHENERPSIGDNVTIGSGAKVLGGIVIGNNVSIGANAVVTKDLPDNVIAVGVPAKIIGNVTLENRNTETIL